MSIYRAAAWIGYYWIFSVTFMNFCVAKLYGNGGTFYEDTKVEKQ